jgi:hypothetical protein
MATGPSVPFNNNTYAPIDISNRLRIGFSRNVKKFKLPQYVQYVQVEKGNGYFLKLTAQEAARVVDVEDFAWPDGQMDPSNDEETESFNFVPFTTKRHRYKFRIGHKAANQAVWPIVQQNSDIKAAQCMTARTVRMLAQATTVANWQASSDTDNLSADHTSDFETLVGVPGARADNGTPDAPYLKIFLGQVAVLVNADTLGVVDSDPEKFLVIANPNTTRLIAASAEIHKYISNSVWAQKEIESGQHPNGAYGLPSKIYGYNWLVENAVRVTSRRGGTQTKSLVVPDGVILVVSRVGDLEGVYGAPSFSTLTMFWYQDEMTVETESRSWDRLTLGRVVEDTFEAVTCPASGYLGTNCTGG